MARELKLDHYGGLSSNNARVLLKKKFGCSLIEIEDNVKTQGEDSHLQGKGEAWSRPSFRTVQKQ